MSIKKPQAKKPAPKKKTSAPVKQAEEKEKVTKKTPTKKKEVKKAPKGTTKKDAVKKPETKELNRPINLAVMLFEMQMHAVSRHLLTDKQRKSLSKKLENHRDKTRESCISFLDGKREDRAKGIRSLAVAYFLKVSKKNKKRIQESVKKSFQTF